MSDVNEQPLLAPSPDLAQSGAGSAEALQAEILRLKQAVLARQRLGLVTGLVAERYKLDPDEAWEFLVRLSQNTNVKLREVARVVYDDFCGCLADEDWKLASQLNAVRPKGTPPLVDLKRAADTPPAGEGPNSRAAR